MTDPKSRIKFTTPAQKRQPTPDDEPRPGPIRRRSSIAYHFVKDLIKPKQEDPVAPRPRRRSSAALQRLRDLVIPSKENLADDRLRLRRSSTDALKGLRDRLTPTRETFALGRKSKEERRRFEHVKPGVSVQKFDQDVGTTKLDPPLEPQTLVVTLPGALTLDGVAAEPAKPQDAKQEASSKPKKAYKSKFTEVFEGDAGYQLQQSHFQLLWQNSPQRLQQSPPQHLRQSPLQPFARVVHRVPFLDDPSEPESRIDQSFFGVGEWPPHLIEDWTTGSKILIPHSRRAEEHRVDKRDPPEINPKAEKGVTMRLGVTGEDDPRRWKVRETYVDEPVAYTADVVAEPKGRAKWGDVEPYGGT
nr:hypothetical protein B0A51_00414 [Rachicladosporium sp. CCFEE 5018]